MKRDVPHIQTHICCQVRHRVFTRGEFQFTTHEAVLLIPIELALCYGSRVSKTRIDCYGLAYHSLRSLMYAPLAPIVVICAAIYFWTLYIIVSVENNEKRQMSSEAAMD